MSVLFTPLEIRGITFRNRIFVSPMCQYSSEDGMPNDWHLVHLGSRAVGGAGLVTVEATAVCPEGRISPADSGLWSHEHARAFQRITSFLHQHGAAAGVQLAHAGRKASTAQPWKGGGPLDASQGGWETLAPSPIPFDEGWPAPKEMTKADIADVVARIADAAKFAREAGFDVLALHMAHGYLVHQFLSPLSNRRTDEYGGSLNGRMRLALEVARAAREAWPADLPLFVRISATDWADGGWDLDQSIVLARKLKEAGVDLIECSSGGTVPRAKIPAGRGYQVGFAAAIRKEAGIATGAIGFITEPSQAEQILVTGQADAILMAREFLRDPYWPLHAAQALGVDVAWPVQYERAKRR